ncbi:MAG: MarR family transcriptional regulator [Proteobacteria bacterium]|nr:MarR family transcriptional regulator [Pseudomonadota bacterium]
MADGLIPDDIKQFILQYIDSIAQWEALLILRNDPDRLWTIEDLAARLYTTPQETARLIERLMAGGFLQLSQSNPPQYQYNYIEPLDVMVGRMAELYKQYLIPITHLIHSKSKSRIQAFADAFRLRKD